MDAPPAPTRTLSGAMLPLIAAYWKVRVWDSCPHLCSRAHSIRPSRARGRQLRTPQLLPLHTPSAGLLEQDRRVLRCPETVPIRSCELRGWADAGLRVWAAGPSTNQTVQRAA